VTEGGLAEREPIPPWERYPSLGRYSLGWRMGSGESYWMRWSAFMTAQVHGADEAIAYFGRHALAPRTWRDVVAGYLSPDDAELDDDGQLSPAVAAQIEAAGLVGDDVAYPTFVRNAEREGGMTAPWTWRVADEGPDPAFRYCVRELGWWTRWLVSACGDRAAWLAAQPPAPAAWAALLPAVLGTEDRNVGPWRDLGAGSAVLVRAMLVHGALPPPWLGAHPPLEALDWNDDANNRDRWAWWVFDTFEDIASWRAYLDRWPPPADWEQALRETLFPELYAVG
jgi:hypothetical protein